MAVSFKKFWDAQDKKLLAWMTPLLVIGTYILYRLLTWI